MTALEICALLVIAVASFGMSYLGAAVGLVLGHFRVVLITYVLGSAVAGAATSMAISTVSTFTGVVTHTRGGRVQIAPLLLIGVPSALTAYLAARWAARFDPRTLKLAIACTVLIAAVDLLRRRAPQGTGTAATGTPRPVRGTAVDARWGAIAAQVLLGTVFGAISGVVGLLLGSLRLPTMVRLGISPATAVGTNMAIGAVTGVSAGAAALAGGRVNLIAFAVVSPLSLLGSYLGARRTAKLDPVRLKKWIACALFITAAIMFADLLFARAR